MRRLTYCVASTIDGVIAGPDGADPTGSLFLDGDHLAAMLGELSDMLPVHARAALDLDPPVHRWDTVVEGRRSYQVGLDAGIADAYPHLRHVVASRTVAEPPDPAVELVTDPVAAVRRLKAEPGDLGIWLASGGTLTGALLGEIDHLVLKLNPVVAGSGRPLFGGVEYDPHRFTLVDQTTYDSGVTILNYARAADAGPEPAAF